ncbi:hypothetical protein H8N03_11680 [Ramlibacter sp. USB13]|uniref:Cytochrome c domain-containing protein n=1 Tax=Ramlibacter cellulosilyticus TaxID=2764187 RepID=A0A923MTP3_9BURK|nr:hypothetical protein [Ramlibacter cellulosilyticus]MBC5783607.1 hypothetical protein [Ramlibacter cellulosilyticus]
MKSTASHVRAAVLAVAALLAPRADAQQQPQVPPAVAGLARAIAAELVMHCPLADADDAGAFESCRAALEEGGVLRKSLPDFVLWGREGAEPARALERGTFAQLAPEVWTRLYAPLFMFNGNHRVEWVAAENQFVIRLEAAFRNRLAPGQFPYPFWHDEATWSAYQHANGVLLWVQPQTGRVHVAQFTERAATPPLQPVSPVARRFEGQWSWTDAAGRMQPAVTLFDGQYRAGNPHRPAIDRTWRDLALQLREADCSRCHAPDNAERSRRLVLLSSPAHAAGEIERVIRVVREPTPRLKVHALSADDKQWLLQSAEAFRDTVRSARAWEAEAARRDQAREGQGAERAVSLRAETELRLRP